MTTKHKTYVDVLEELEKMDNDDENMLILERAMNYYCGMYDKCEGYKLALKETILDQYENHLDEQKDNDMDKLWDILNKAI